MRFKNILKFTIFSALFTVVLFSCKKDNEDRPASNEPINILSPDSTTIYADAGSTVNLELYLAIDKAIDTIRGAYLIDTSMMVQNLTFNDMDSVFFVQGFEDTSNVQSVTTSFTVPSQVADSIPFKPYFSGSTTPYAPPSYDAIRIIFKLEAQDNSSYEKQLKIIIN